MIKALLIDVDGVLIRGRPDDGRPWASALAEDLGFGTEVLQREFFRPHWEDIVVGRASLHERLAPVLARIAPDLPVERFVDYWFANDARIDKQLIADLDAARASGYQAYLATNQEHARARYLMGDLGLSDHVDGIHYSASLGCRKPDPAFFRAVEHVLDLPAQNLLLIDDDDRNVAAARTNGWQARQWTGDRRLPDILRAFA